MSTKVMALCWPISNLSILQKAVLISLADQANDQGVCWPSVGTICERVCGSERAVRRAISELVDMSLVGRNDRPGKPTYYTITPAANDPLPQMHPCQKEHEPLPEVPLTPARSAHITVIEPSKEPSKDITKKKTSDSIPAKTMREEMPDLHEQTITDYLAVRKAKRAPMTRTAWDSIKEQILIAQQRFGIPPNEALCIAVKRNWVGIESDWIGKHLGVIANETNQRASGKFIPDHEDTSWAAGLADELCVR